MHSGFNEAKIGSMNKREVIVSVLTEGGSITLCGCREGETWLFARSTSESIDEESAFTKSDCVDSWNGALGLLDKYPWFKLTPEVVHPEFRELIWTAIQERLKDDSESTERWRAMCA
jgi:hypothetical protein